MPFPLTMSFSSFVAASTEFVGADELVLLADELVASTEFVGADELVLLGDELVLLITSLEISVQ